MDGRVLHATRTFDEIRHAPSGPEARTIPERFGSAPESLFNPTHIRGRELRRPTGPRRALQGRAPARREELRPAVHRLAMDAHAPGDLGFAHALLEEPAPLYAPSLQLHAINLDPGWMSHAGQSTRVLGYCHYVL